MMVSSPLTKVTSPLTVQNEEQVQRELSALGRDEIVAAWATLGRAQSTHAAGVYAEAFGNSYRRMCMENSAAGKVPALVTQNEIAFLESLVQVIEKSDNGRSEFFAADSVRVTINAIRGGVALRVARPEGDIVGLPVALARLTRLEQRITTCIGY